MFSLWIHCENFILLLLNIKWFGLYLYLAYISSYKRDAVEKLKMSNSVITDVYLSNSRCVRNNDKPADNNVFTGRLPVSTGLQHHHWQHQQQQQLLMQADGNVA